MAKTKVKHIHLFHEFRGRLTHEVSIPAGIYEEEDPRLRGLTEYFVANELAAYTDEAPEIRPDNPEPNVPQRFVRTPERATIKETTRKLSGRELPDSAVTDLNTTDETDESDTDQTSDSEAANS